MDVMKERWEAPRTVYEGFVVDQYVAACVETGEWRPKPDAEPYPSKTKFALDNAPENGHADDNEIKNFVTTNAANQPITNISYWGWEIIGTGGNAYVNEANRFRLFQTVQNPQQYLAYEDEWVTNKNLS